MLNIMIEEKHLHPKVSILQFLFLEKNHKKWRKSLFDLPFFRWFRVPENRISGTHSATNDLSDTDSKDTFDLYEGPGPSKNVFIV